jgi:hypothetical protein
MKAPGPTTPEKQPRQSPTLLGDGRDMCGGDVVQGALRPFAPGAQLAAKLPPDDDRAALGHGHLLPEDPAGLSLPVSADRIERPI